MVGSLALASALMGPDAIERGELGFEAARAGPTGWGYFHQCPNRGQLNDGALVEMRKLFRVFRVFYLAST